VFVIQAAFAAVGCAFGFVISGTSAIPILAGWGLLIGAVLSALASPAKLGWTAAWMPPLAAAAVITVMGQVTLLGSAPTLAREVGMVAAGLTAVAPAQLLSVLLATLILWRRGRRPGATAAAV
jgi:hypothetical protein